MQDIRPEVMRFAALMEEKLRKNDHKGGWQACSPGWLYGRLCQEVDELKKALLGDGTFPRKLRMWPTLR